MSGKLDQHYAVETTHGHRHKAKQDTTSKVTPAFNTHDAHMKILREFDLNHEFGPCAGMSRLERWERAREFGLAPPERVRQLILQHPNDVDYTQSLWHERL